MQLAPATRTTVRAVLAQLLPRVHSRLGIRRVNFHPYGVHEIATILNDRLGTRSATRTLTLAPALTRTRTLTRTLAPALTLALTLTLTPPSPLP